MASNTALVVFLMIAHVHMAEGAMLKTIQNRSFAASGVPDPHCQTGIISLTGSPKSCCPSYCGQCNDYETCKSVNGQNSENACCASKVYTMRCGNAPANVCLKTCSEAVPPCIMDKDVDAMDVKLGAQTQEGVPPCNAVVPFTAKSHARAITKGHFMAELHLVNSDLQEALDITTSAKSELHMDDMVKSYLADLPEGTSKEYEATIKLADNVLANAPKSISKVQELQKEATANKVNTDIPDELELNKDGEKNNALLFLRDAKEVKQASQSLQEQALDHAAKQAHAKAAAAHNAEKAELHRKVRELVKSRSAARNGTVKTESMGLLGVETRNTRANSTEKLNATTEIATIVQHQMLDIAAMATGMTKDSAANVARLQTDCDNMKPMVKQAKQLFKTDRQNIRNDHKSCKHQIKHDKQHWRTDWQCKPFVAYMTGLLQVQGEEYKSSSGEKTTRTLLSKRNDVNYDDEVYAEVDDDDKAGYVTQGGRRRGKESHHEEHEQKKAAKCSETPKCELRQAARQAKEAAKQDYEKVHKQYKQDLQQLRAAKFQQSILPKVILLLNPNLATAVNQFHVATDDLKNLVQACEKALPKATCIPIAQMDFEVLLKQFMNLYLNSALFTDLTDIFKKIKSLIWKVFNPLMSAIANSLIASVGSIPFVGGVLATAVDVLFDVLYGVIRKAVDIALDDVEAILQGDILTAIDKAVFKAAKFTDKALQDKSQAHQADLASTMTTSGNAATSEPVSSTNKQIADQAAQAKTEGQQKAAGATDAVTDAGNDVSQAQNKDDEENQQMMSGEDSEDIKADNEDSS
jgi:hypothetical protein